MTQANTAEVIDFEISSKGGEGVQNSPSFALRALERAGLADVAHLILEGKSLDYASALKLTSAPIPEIAKLVEMRVLRDGARLDDEPRIRPLFFFPLAQLLQERGTSHAVAACINQLQRLNETVTAKSTIYWAIDKWSGDFSFESLLEALALVGRNASVDFDFVPVGPSANDLLALASKESGESLTDIFTEDFFDSLKEIGICAIEGGCSLDLQLLAAENNLLVSVGHDISELNKREHGKERSVQSNLPRKQFVDDLFLLREVLEPTGNFSAWFPWFGVADQSGSGPLAVDSLWAIATARLVLSRVQYIQAPISALGPKLAHVAIAFGANDLGFAAIDSSTADTLGIARLSDTNEIISQHQIWARVCK